VQHVDGRECDQHHADDGHRRPGREHRGRLFGFFKIRAQFRLKHGELLLDQPLGVGKDAGE